jgi:hypothetical protein
MLPILWGIGAAITSAITTTEAVVIGAATATGVGLLSRNRKSVDNETESEKSDSIAFETAFREAYAKAYKGGNIAK